MAVMASSSISWRDWARGENTAAESGIMAKLKRLVALTGVSAARQRNEACLSREMAMAASAGGQRKNRRYHGKIMPLLNGG